eukprot:scaffold22.g6084.t1
MARLRPLTVVDLVVADHHTINALFARFHQAREASEPQAVPALVTALAVEVLLHSRAEEQVLYPFLERALGDEGRSFSEHSDKEHKQLEATLMRAMRQRSLHDGGEHLAATLEEARKELIDLGQRFSEAKHRAPLDQLAA